MKEILSKTSFWKRVKDSVALIGTGTEFGLVLSEASHTWMLVTSVATFAVYILGIWMEDKDNNGTIDIFEGK